MPRRPRSHVISTRATAAVGKVVADAGFAVEPVVNDYGEDLLVQTAHAGQMDASRLWIQVKGTQRIDRFRRADGRLRLSLPFAQVLRWLRSADPVIVVLWDVSSESGYWAWPMGQISAWDARASERKRAILSFDPAEARFDVNSAREIGWLCRFVHYWRLLLSAEGVEREAAAQGKTKAEVGPLATAIVIDFLELLEVVESQEAGIRLKAESHERLMEWLERIDTSGREFLDDSSDDPTGEAIILAASVVIEEQQERLSGFRFEDPEHVIPQELLLSGASVVRGLLFPYGWGAPSINGPVEIPFEFIVKVCRRSGVRGSVAFVNAPKERDVIVLLEESDVARAEEGMLIQALSALLRVPARIVTDASPWGGDVLSLTP